MALAPTNLTQSGSASSASSYNTASISPTANALVLAFVWHSHSPSAGSAPTLSGAGLTWVSITTFTFATTERASIFRAMSASPSTGAVTISFGATSQTQCGWCVTQFTGVDTSGTNGSGAVIQSATNSGTSATPSVTLAAFANANNGTYGVIVQNTTTQLTPGSGFTEIADTQVIAATFRIEDEWKSTNDTSVDWSTSNNAYGAIALEIAPAAATTLGDQNFEPVARGTGLGMFRGMRRAVTRLAPRRRLTPALAELEPLRKAA